MRGLLSLLYRSPVDGIPSVSSDRLVHSQSVLSGDQIVNFAGRPYEDSSRRAKLLNELQRFVFGVLGRAMRQSGFTTHVAEQQRVRILLKDREDVVAAVAFNGVEAIRAEFVDDDRQDLFGVAVSVLEELESSVFDRLGNSPPDGQCFLTDKFRAEDRSRTARHVLTHKHQ